MRVAYVSGPYRGPTLRDVINNIRAAEAVAIELWRMGLSVICPHKNTELFDGTLDMKYISDGINSHWNGGEGIQFIKGDCAMIDRLRPRYDFLVLIPGWMDSQGAAIEKQHAEWNGLIILYWPQDKERLKLFLSMDEGKLTQCN